MQSISGFRYSVGTIERAVTAERALIRILGSATSIAIVHEIRCGQSGDAGDTEAEVLQLELRRYTSEVTTGAQTLTELPMGAGAGRTAAHEIKYDSAVSTSTSVLLTDTFNIQAGFLYLPAPDDRLIVPAVASEGLELVMAAPNDSLSMVASIVWEEIPIT